MRGTVRIGIAVGLDSITAVVRASAQPAIRVVCPLSAAQEDLRAALGTAFETLAAELEAITGTRFPGAIGHVALLPPLVDARLVPLPPLRPAEAAAVLQRDAARHFVGGTGLRTIAVHVPAFSRRSTDPPRPVFAVAASPALVDAIHDACNEAGCHVRSIGPAHAAWIAAAKLKGERDNSVLVARVADTIHLIHLNGDDPVGLRRLPAAADDELLDAIGAGPGRMIVFDSADVQNCKRAVTSAGWQVQSRDGPSDAEEIAAAFAHTARMEFTTPALGKRRADRQRTWTALFAVAATVLLLLTAAMQFWGLRRELDSIQARRSEIRAAVAPLLASRDSLMNLEERLARLERLQSRPGRLSSALFDVAVLLPPDSYLSAFRTKADTLIITGLSPRAAGAIEALRSAESFRNVELDGIIDRELDAGATTQERFTVEALLPPADTLKAVRRVRGATIASGKSSS